MHVILSKLFKATLRRILLCKQKTANERRISDWSSDVCSSDLLADVGPSDDGELQHALVAGDHLLATVVGQRISNDHEARRQLTVGGIQREIFLMRQSGRASCRERGCQSV